jgi:hypothetical protein
MRHRRGLLRGGPRDCPFKTPGAPACAYFEDNLRALPTIPSLILTAAPADLILFGYEEDILSDFGVLRATVDR